MLLAVIAASIGAGLLVAAGLVSLTGLPKIVSAQDVSAYRALNLVTVGLLLAGTFATGWAEVLTGVTGLTKHSLPKILSSMLLLDGLVEIFEFLFPFFVMVDSAFGLIMGIWLGILLLRNGERAHGLPRPPVHSGGPAGRGG